MYVNLIVRYVTSSLNPWNVRCLKLGLKVLSYLWRRDQEELLDEMIACDMHSILIKVASMGMWQWDLPSYKFPTPLMHKCRNNQIGLKKVHLGKSLKDMKPYLKELVGSYTKNAML